jgi:hypothetical protein
MSPGLCTLQRETSVDEVFLTGKASRKFLWAQVVAYRRHITHGIRKRYGCIMSPSCSSPRPKEA